MSDVSDLSQVVDDGVLSEAFSILRSTGTFELGGWTTTSVLVPGWGVVSVAQTEDLIMISEGDKVSGAMVFHTKSRIYETIRDQNYQGLVQGSGSIQGFGADPFGSSPFGGVAGGGGGAVPSISGRMVNPTNVSGTCSGIAAPGTGNGVSVQRVSDIMVWNAELWRVMKVGPYPNRTFWKAIAVRIQGD